MRSRSRPPAERRRSRAIDRFVPTARARRAPVFTLYFENDTFSGTDQHYTNGVKTLLALVRSRRLGTVRLAEDDC
jgi:hypothetical protein